MRNDEQSQKIKHCHDNGYRIFIRPIDLYTYRIVVSKATKYKWSEIEKEKQKDYQMVDGIIYSLKVGEILFKAKPKENDPKWYDRIPELYESIYQKLTNKN